ncbi:MAG: 4'-phosphopantetheinyl transferase superfamily protein [Bacteroidales bacterium]|nr:4'-phosphopantetheinyl transferase superfamily protein [Bacteroidales bacterium]
MGLLLKEYVEDDCLLGIWDITENYDELLLKVNLLQEEQELLNSFGRDLRKIEWLSVRVLLREMMGQELSIYYNGNRKPFIKGNAYHISISHSNQFSSILLSNIHKVGIDMEFMSHRISNISHRFMNDREQVTSDEDLKRYHLYIHWCAKEALYKICDKQDIDFRKNIIIEPFNPERQGELKGLVSSRSRKEYFKLNYFTIDNYVIVYTVK